VRSFAEWRLLSMLAERGLPVPTPVAARYRRTGILYRCDLITERIAGAEPLSSTLVAGPLAAELWSTLGATIARFHAAGVDHADLNAHNILFGGMERRNAGRAVFSLIDFDRGRLHQPSVSAARPNAWMSRNLSRLQRSLWKITRRLPQDRFGAAAWQHLLAGYAAAP
jgi:3-deoxy-D-manno-octulosonic acid kinase